MRRAIHPGSIESAWLLFTAVICNRSCDLREPEGATVAGIGRRDPAPPGTGHPLPSEFPEQRATCARQFATRGRLSRPGGPRGFLTFLGLFYRGTSASAFLPRDLVVLTGRTRVLLDAPRSGIARGPLVDASCRG